MVKHQIDLREVLGIIAGCYAKELAARGSIQLNSLLSRQAQEKLDEEIARIYPGGENVRNRKTVDQLAALYEAVPGFESQDPQRLGSDYNAWLDRVRRERKKLARKNALPYRNNPWL